MRAMAVPPTVLITGASGLVAGALSARLAAGGWRVLATTRRRGDVSADWPFLDLAEGEAAGRDLPAADAVVLAAAEARLGACEDEPERTRRLNVAGNLAVARRACAEGAFVLFLSSDKVFDGRVPFRRRGDAPCPSSEYGRQKAAAEADVLALPRGAVLRLSKVLAPGLALLAEWEGSLRAGRPVTPFLDMFLAPVDTQLVAELAARILEERAPGIWQASGREERSYAGLALAVAGRLGADSRLVRPAPADPARFPLRNRPLHSTLDMRAEAERWGVAAPDFDAVLERCLRP